MKVIHLVPVLAIALFTGACEKQSYSETRAFTHHGSHAAAGGPAAEGAAAAHGKPAAEKPAAH